MPAPSTTTPAEKVMTCPFTVLVDTREQAPYTFQGLRGTQKQHNALIQVPTRRATLPVGDYAIDGEARGIIVERKSKADLFGSVVRRENFEDRLYKMSAWQLAMVVVECELFDLIRNPPPYAKYPGKSLVRTVGAWSQRYPVRWWFLPGREAAEAWTFRQLERWWLDKMSAAEQTAQGYETDEPA